MLQDRLNNKAGQLGSASKDSYRYIQGVKLNSSPLGFHYVRKFPWKEDIDKVWSLPDELFGIMYVSSIIANIKNFFIGHAGFCRQSSDQPK